MIDTILPSAVIAVEAREDLADIVLFPEEEASIGRAVEKRRREFTTARACVREAFSRLGLPPSAVVNGARGEPCWPAGIVGSITHCEGYRACAIARSADIVSVGIDAEPHAALPEGLLPDIAGGQELSWLRDRSRARPDVHWDRLLFSAKEAVYKAWYPLAQRWLGFEDAVLELQDEVFELDDAALELDPSAGAFTARLLVPGPSVAGRTLTGFSGRWLVRDGLVLTAIALPATAAAQGALNPSSAAPRPTH